MALLADPRVTTIVVEHRDRFARFGSEYVEAALSAQGRRLLVADPSEVDDDLVRDVTEILTSLCARLYGKHAAANRAARAVECATRDEVRVTALTRIVSFASLGIYLGFMMVVLAALRARLKGWTPSGRFTLGRWGLLVNIAARFTRSPPP